MARDTPASRTTSSMVVRVMPVRAMQARAAVRIRSSVAGATGPARPGASVVEIAPITVRHYVAICLTVYANRT